MIRIFPNLGFFTRPCLTLVYVHQISPNRTETPEADAFLLGLVSPVVSDERGRPQAVDVRSLPRLTAIRFALIHSTRLTSRVEPRCCLAPELKLPGFWSRF